MRACIETNDFITDAIDLIEDDPAEQTIQEDDNLSSEEEQQD
jgi:hypothetical protein